ncbi:MAG: hypothetical protein ACLRYE_03085 [Gemmiger formicilis]|uniref:hypothetical protein n=1 Tax=Gemmiger formicilis TaxID=745368 RepID=UPI0039A1B6E1
MTPYHHNEPVPTPLTLPLQRGRNKLLVFFDNYAERDAADHSAPALEGRGHRARTGHPGGRPTRPAWPKPST